MGVKIRTMWMAPFYLFFGVLVIYIFQSQINLNKLKGFTTVFLILFIFSPFVYAYVSITETDKRTDYLGKEEAKKAREFYGNQIEVIGDLSKGLFYMESQLEDFIIQNWDESELGKKYELIYDDGD